jgi:hypothetical protein
MLRYHLQDVVIGKIYFLLVRIKIKHMEVVIIKRESTGSGTLISIICRCELGLTFLLLYVYYRTQHIQRERKRVQI